MAFPVVEAVATTDSPSGVSHTVNLPAGIQAGETLIVVGSRNSVATFPGDWTELLDEAVARGFSIAYKKASGSEGSTIGVTTGTAVVSGWIALRISGAADPTIQPPEIPATATGTSADPDAPSLTPTGGAKDYLWIPVFTKNGVDVSAGPTSYSGFTEREYGGAAASLGMAWRQRNIATEDPGAFDGSVSTAWRGQTIAIHPAPPAGPIAQTLPALTQSAAATVGPNTGPVAQALPGLQQSAEGETALLPIGPIAQTLPTLTTAAAATVGPMAGPIAQTLPVLAQSIIGPSTFAVGAPSSDRHLSFRYELLDSDNVHKDWLEGVMSGSVANNALAQIKRTARFDILDTDDIDWLSDRIRPWVTLNDVEYPLGVFLLSSPTRRHDGILVTRDVEAFDQAVVLRDDRLTTRHTVATGTNYITEVAAQLAAAGITATNLAPTAKTLPAAREWDPGTSRLQIVNDLLGAINYRTIYFDENGVAIAEPYVSPTLAAPDHTYADDEDSIILRGVDEAVDLFDIPNQWVLYTSEPGQTSLRSTYTNTNPNSPTSTVSRGRTIVDYRQVEAADQDALDAMVERLAFEASQVYTTVEMATAISPTHGEADVVDFTFSRLGIAARYSEHTWDFDLKAGAQMRHRLRRVVAV